MSEFARLYDGFLAILAGAAALLILFVMASIATEVAGRYFFNSPLGWVIELSEYTLIYTTFLGMPWLVRRTQGHVRIDVVVASLNPKTQAGLEVGVSLVVAMVCVFAAYYAVLTTWDHYVREVMTHGIYTIPKYWLLILVAVAFTLSTIEFLRRAYGDFHKWRAMDSPDQEQTP